MKAKAHDSRCCKNKQADRLHHISRSSVKYEAEENASRRTAVSDRLFSWTWSIITLEIERPSVLYGMETTKTPGRQREFVPWSDLFLRDRASWRYLLCRTRENRCLCDLFFTVHRSSMDNHWLICMEVTRTSGRCTQETVWLLIRSLLKRLWASSAVTKKGKSLFVRLALHCSSIENLHQCSQYWSWFDSPLSIESGGYAEKRAKMNESFWTEIDEKWLLAEGNESIRESPTTTTIVG